MWLPCFLALSVHLPCWPLFCRPLRCSVLSPFCSWLCLVSLQRAAVARAPRLAHERAEHSGKERNRVAPSAHGPRSNAMGAGARVGREEARSPDRHEDADDAWPEEGLPDRRVDDRHAAGLSALCCRNADPRPVPCAAGAAGMPALPAASTRAAAAAILTCDCNNSTMCYKI